MSKFLFGLILGIVLLLAAEYLFVAHGGLYMGANGERLPMEQHLANKAIAAHAPRGERDCDRQLTPPPRSLGVADLCPDAS